MGNLVTFSVRHDLISEIRAEDFSEISDLMNDPDIKIKVHQPGGEWADEFVAKPRVPGLISSQYHHSEDHCDLLISNQWLTVLPWGLNLSKHRAHNWAKFPPPDQVLVAARALLAESRTHVLKPDVRPPEPNPVRSAYTVFGFKTDYCNDLEKIPDLVAHLLHHCRTGEENRRINSRCYQIESLGTYDADTSVLVTMSRGSFAITPLRFAPLAISPEIQLAACSEGYQRSRRVNGAIDQSKMKSVAQGLGFDLQPSKVMHKEAAWAPK